MDYTKCFYPESEFGGFTDVSGTVRFYVRVRSLLQPHFTVLDVGCGSGSNTKVSNDFVKSLRVLKGDVQRVIGIDMDPVGGTNTFIDEFRLLNSTQWPIDSNSIDLAISDWTMEHVEDPDAFLRECYRVLAPGGYLCMRTTNRLGYVAFMSSVIPSSFHAKILGRVQPSRPIQDVFPTVYRCNTIGKLRTALHKLGFKGTVYGHEAEPSYLGFSYVAYLLGVLYQRVAPNFLRSTLYVFAQKPRTGVTQ